MADRERMFRDETGAALERVAALEAENAELRARLAGGRVPSPLGSVIAAKPIAVVVGVLAMGGLSATIAMPRPVPKLVVEDPQFSIPQRVAVTPLSTPFATASQVPEPGLPVTMREVALDVRGPYPKDVVTAVVNANKFRVSACYADALADKSDLKGTVGVRFDVGPSGDVVSAAESAGDLREPAVVTCIVHLFGTTSFPAAIPSDKGATSVTYTVAFQPGPPARPIFPSANPNAMPPTFFDRSAAARELGALDVQSCKRPDGPTGSGHAKITFGSDGRVQTVLIDAGPFVGNPTGTCIDARLHAMHIPPFAGPSVVVGKTFTVL